MLAACVMLSICLLYCFELDSGGVQVFLNHIWEESNVTKIVGMMLFLIAVSGVALANGGAVPEIDPGSGGTALALLSGALMVIRGRRKAR